MLNVIDIALAYPARTEHLVDLAEELSLTRNQLRMFDRFFGFDRFHRDDALSVQQLIGQASTALLARNASCDARLSHVVHSHTLPAVSVFGGATSAVLAPFLARGLEVFSATMNHCATGLTMLGTLDQLLGDDETGLILIGEKAFHPDIRVIENTTIMGEAAAAVLVGRGPGRYQIIDSYTQHETRFCLNSGHKNEAYLAGFEQAYLGFAQDSLQRAMQRFGLDFSDIRYVLPHNVNLTSWYQIAQGVGLQKAQLCLETIGRYGHCFGADPFINLMHVADQGALSAGDWLLLFSIGLGATASCVLLQVCATSEKIQIEQREITL